MYFSEDSAFLLKNWSQVEKFHDVESNLRKEVSNLLHSLEGVLSDRYWWDHRLSFYGKSRDQVYISRSDWTKGNNNLIWIGVEDFTVERLFSSSFPPRCFLYCLNVGDRDKIRSELLKVMRQDNHFRGYLTDKKGYVLIKHINKYTDTQYEKFAGGEPLNEIADFIEKVYIKIEGYSIKNDKQRV